MTSTYNTRRPKQVVIIPLEVSEELQSAADVAWLHAWRHGHSCNCSMGGEMHPTDYETNYLTTFRRVGRGQPPIPRFRGGVDPAAYLVQAL